MPLTRTPTSLQLLLGPWPSLKHTLQDSVTCKCCLCRDDAAMGHHLL